MKIVEKRRKTSKVFIWGDIQVAPDVTKLEGNEKKSFTVGGGDLVHHHHHHHHHHQHDDVGQNLKS
jgi:hypothetical protein